MPVPYLYQHPSSNSASVSTWASHCLPYHDPRDSFITSTVFVESLGHLSGMTFCSGGAYNALPLFRRVPVSAGQGVGRLFAHALPPNTFTAICNPSALMSSEIVADTDVRSKGSVSGRVCIQTRLVCRAKSDGPSSQGAVEKKGPTSLWSRATYNHNQSSNRTADREEKRS